MKYKLFTALLAVILFTHCTSNNGTRTTEESDAEDISSYLQPPGSELPILDFKEIWAYVIPDRESALTRGLPITDIAYFGAEVDAFGKLVNVPRRSALPSHFTGRVHLVIACNGRALSHFVLKPGSPERREFIADLIAATRNYDGLNIDLEYISVRNAETFASFLRELRAGLPRDKMFTICVPARTRKLNEDAYDYDRLTPLVDRVFVMAYDEHWSGSRPGSVASIAWCRRVADYSMRAIGPGKLVMGLPFYGRAWGDYSPSRALVHSSIENIIRDHNITDIRYDNGIPTLTYNKNVSIRIFYEDVHSLVTRMNMYKSMGIESIGFWRLGQETTDIWNHLRLSSASTAARTSTVTTAPAVSAAPAAAPSAPAGTFTGRYTVQRGDSLWVISRRYGITPQALADANNMRLNDNLHVGRVLRVPAQ